MCYMMFLQTNDKHRKRGSTMKQGYSVITGSQLYFMPTDATRKTKIVVNEFIERMGQAKGLCDDLIERCKADADCFKLMQFKMSPCTLEERTTCTIKYYHIEGKGFIQNVPFDENCVFII